VRKGLNHKESFIIIEVSAEKEKEGEDYSRPKQGKKITFLKALDEWLT